MEFTEFKNEIIERAKKADACSKGIRHAKQAIDYKELFDVISENFSFCCDNKIIDVALLKNVEDLALTKVTYTDGTEFRTFDEKRELKLRKYKVLFQKL